jgi:uncharacterized protein YacL
MKKMIAVIMVAVMLVTGCNKAKEVVNPVVDEVKGKTNKVKTAIWETGVLSFAAICSYYLVKKVKAKDCNASVAEIFFLTIGVVFSLVLSLLPLLPAPPADNRVLKLTDGIYSY